MRAPTGKSKDRRRLSARPLAEPPRPLKRTEPPRKARRATTVARQITSLVREAGAAERAAQDALQAYTVRQQLDQRMSALADRIAGKPRICPDELLALALAGWHAAGARGALVRAILRSRGINPSAPHLRWRAQR
jgi:hypothetical protein